MLNLDAQNHLRPVYRQAPRSPVHSSFANSLPSARPDSVVGGILGNALRGPEGFGLDLNGSGHYEQGKDAVLAFDLNGDGKIDDGEISRSREILNSVNKPKLQGPCGLELDNPNYAKAKEMGLTNGPVSSWELARAGGRVLVDEGRNPLQHNWASYSTNNFPTPNGERGMISCFSPEVGASILSRR